MRQDFKVIGLYLCCGARQPDSHFHVSRDNHLLPYVFPLLLLVVSLDVFVSLTSSYKLFFGFVHLKWVASDYLKPGNIETIDD